MVRVVKGRQHGAHIHASIAEIESEAIELCSKVINLDTYFMEQSLHHRFHHRLYTVCINISSYIKMKLLTISPVAA
jgi:hypothetical protein